MPNFDTSMPPLDDHVSVSPDAPMDDFNKKALSKKSGFKLKYGLALVALVAVVGGILAFTQSALRQSQETRSDAAIEDEKIWISFMSDPATADADPVGLSSLNMSRSSDSTVSVWLNNPNFKEITNGAVFIKYDPASINSIAIELANQPYLDSAHQPVELVNSSYVDSATNSRVAVMKFSAKCVTDRCYPLKKPGEQYIKLANLTISPKANATAANTTIRFLFSDNNTRSLILVKDKDVSLLQKTGFVKLDANFSDAPNISPTPTGEAGAKPGKVVGLVATPFCATSRNQLEWTQLANADSYQIQHCKGTSCTNWVNVEASFAETIYVHTGVTAGLHRYRVRGKNAAGNGAWSVVASAQIQSNCAGASPTPTIASATPSPTEGVGTKPAKVTGLTIAPACSMQKNELSWTAAARATAYTVRYCKGGACTPNNNLSSTLTTTSYVHQNLTAGLYRYQVRATNAVGSGAWSDIKQGRIDADCTQVTPTATSAASTPTPTTPFAPTEEPSITQTPAQLAGDFNEDGNVSLAELQRVMDAYGQTGNVPENVNADNEVNLLDVTIVLANFLR